MGCEGFCITLQCTHTYDMGLKIFPYVIAYPLGEDLEILTEMGCASARR